MRRVIIILALVPILAAACGKHYWSRQGASVDDFARDSQECARAVAIPMSTNKDYGIVRADYYKGCMKHRGWVRGQHPEPVPPGWYRGFEDEDAVVKLDQIPPQPEVQSPSRISDLPACGRGWTAATARDSQGRWLCRPH